jgi:hypothetical protein
MLTGGVDLVLFQNPHGDDGRVTAVVRSFFVEDATIRVVVKSGAPAGESTFTITTCRRSLTDFQFLQEWLQFENPESWLPILNVPRSPYQIPSKPSRSVLRDIQLRVDCFLRTLLAHSTFSTHELLWEFFLVPDLQQELMMERSKKKAEIRMERIREEFTPIEDIRDVENFVSYAKDSVRSVNYACRSVTRRAMALRYNMFGEFSPFPSPAAETDSINIRSIGLVQVLLKASQWIQVPPRHRTPVRLQPLL